MSLGIVLKTKKGLSISNLDDDQKVTWDLKSHDQLGCEYVIQNELNEEISSFYDTPFNDKESYVDGKSTYSDVTTKKIGEVKNKRSLADTLRFTTEQFEECVFTVEELLNCNPI